MGSIKSVTPIINSFNAEHPQLKNITFIHEGLSTKEGSISFELPAEKSFVSMRQIPKNKKEKQKGNTYSAKVNSLKNWMKRFGHQKLDVLKIDIEGSEYGVLEQLIKENWLPFTQLLVEYHNRFYDGAY